MVAELSNPFYSLLVVPLHDTLDRAGYRTILLTDRADEPVSLEPLVNGSLDRALLTTSSLDSSLPHELARRGVAFVQVGREVDGITTDACVVDNAGGATAVADLLLGLGHDRIGALFGPDRTSTGRERERAFRSRLAERGVHLSPEATRRGPFEYGHGHDGLRTLLALREPLTAIFCANDAIAIGACNAARALGGRCPTA